MTRPTALTLAMFPVYALAADQATISFPEPPPAGFTGTELVIPVRIGNPGTAAINAKFSTRLWQMSSATLVPLGDAIPWWNGRIEAGKSDDANAKIALPDFRAATRLRLQVLAADGTPAGTVDVTAIPRDWLRDEIATLPAPPALYDPQSRIAPAFAKLGIKANQVDDLANVRGSVVIIVPPPEKSESMEAEKQSLATRGIGVVFIAPDIDLAASAPTQLQLVHGLRDALKRKPPARP